ncbi:hypothetical protein Vadar_002440 [Vaccinium darrowii]|uniref:Uncharacterized protein n=1 Tax=Vaccinium darrowii TaxID=229202 RepID=A0ACB7YJ62_9ERIC|nr:hypothetical protein Vadar_002440 [Vaccinium darrowii]
MRKLNSLILVISIDASFSISWNCFYLTSPNGALQGFYLPWYMLGVDLILGNSLMGNLLGIAVGHLYYFLTVLYPLAGGRFNFDDYALKETSRVLMARRQNTKVGGLLRLPPPASLTVLIAIKGNSESKDVGIVNWALDKFVAEGMFMFKLIHVRPTITTVRTAVRSFCLSDAEAYREEIHWQTEKRLQPYKTMCAQKRIHAEIVQLVSDDVVGAISEEVVKSAVNRLVIGASSRGMLFSRRRNLSSEIAESIPKFCAVYVVLKGKLASFRPSELDGSIIEDRSEADISTNSSPIRKSYSQSELTDSSSIASYASFPFPFNSLSTVNQTILYKKENSSGTLDSRFTSLEFDRDDCMSSCPGSSDIGRPSSSLPSGQILETDAFSRVSHQATFRDATLDTISKEVDKSTVDKLVIGASSHGGMCSRCRNESEMSSLLPSDLGTHRIITIPSRMIHSSSNESSFVNSKSQAGAAVDDHAGLHSVIQAPNCRQKAVLNRGSQMQHHQPNQAYNRVDFPEMLPAG